jgi:hypothetical protein
MKTPLLKSNLLIKPSIVLAAAVLTATSLLAPSTAAAADPTYLMPPGPDGMQPFDPNPAAPGSLTGRFMTYGKDSAGKPVPLKTLRITNDTGQTVYPIMRDPNHPPYDPYDDPNKEYRGYIGYEERGKYYFGLKKGESILVRIPLVFWNGGRIAVGTDGQYLTKEGLPLSYDPNAQRSIANAETSGDTIRDGVVMWYRAGEPKDFTPDSEDQLAEWTIRDHAYLSSPQITEKSNGKIPDNQLLTLINYDVSNVESIYLPLAMEANDAWVLPQRTDLDIATNRSKPNLTGGWFAGSHPEVFGWTGAVNTIKTLQDAIGEFTADNNTLLGQYFGGKGWPFYNIPSSINDPNAPRKIPSGANIFPQSPLKNTRSSYNNEIYQLSSGGSARISVNIGWAGGTPDLPPSTILHLNLIERDKIDFLEVGYLVTGRPPPMVTNPIQAGTTVTAVDKTAGTVTLSKPLAASSEACSYVFTRPVEDYASDAMIRLWYSWAQYYLAHWKDKTPSAPTETTINGSIERMRATLTFNEAHPELVKGMAVTGPGLDDAHTEVGRHQGDAVILQIASDKKSVILSQVVNTATNATFTFLAPKSLLWTPTAKGDPGYPLIGDQFKFSDEPKWHHPYEFSQQVYLIMASMNQIGKENNKNVSKYMQDIIGGNMAYIFTNPAKEIGDAQMVIAMIRDMIKSVLRGVSDFTKFPDEVNQDGVHTVWYPNPKQWQGGQRFNVFNLDPFVWFVHVKLGFSGYGFSLDDDKADIGSDGQSQLQLSIAGKRGLKNPHEWFIQAPYGPVKNMLLMYSGSQTDPTEGNTLYHDIKSVSNTTPIEITTKSPHHLSDGDRVLIDKVEGDNAANGRFKIDHVTSDTFELFHGDTPVAPSPGADTVRGGRWAYPAHPYIDTGADLAKVFYRVKGDDPLGTFQGTFVSVNVNGVDVYGNKDGKKFRVWRLGRQNTGRLLLDADVTNADGVPLPAGTYNFTFFGE